MRQRKRGKHCWKHEPAQMIDMVHSKGQTFQKKKKASGSHKNNLSFYKVALRAFVLWRSLVEGVLINWISEQSAHATEGNFVFTISCAHLYVMPHSLIHPE
jgi:hypothetical protein